MTAAPNRPRLLLACALLAAGSAACTPLRGHTGYIIDADLMNSVQPGTDTRQSVQATLGRPTFTGQFDQSEWYYVARNTRNYGFTNPKVNDQVTIKIAFDPAGQVSSVSRSDETLVASVNPYRKVTPTLGRSKSFFEELFGNIGTVGAAGLGGGGDATNPDDTP
ncbi:MAG: outer membrane protein assembly factor BamE [Pseudomonadota bacterium]